MLGLYIHIPFCAAICNYCNFNRGLFDGSLKDRYVDALIAEVHGAGRKEAADTIYFGGGTPSLLERVGFRMYSRLQEMCEFVHLTGVDYRELGPKPTVETLSHLSDRGSPSHKNLPTPSAKAQMKLRFRGTEPAPQLKWPGGKAGS